MKLTTLDDLAMAIAAKAVAFCTIRVTGTHWRVTLGSLERPEPVTGEGPSLAAAVNAALGAMEPS